MTNQTISTDGTRRIVHNLIILDESGSMGSIKQATVTGFNEIVQTIKGVEEQFPDQQQFVSLITFNGLGTKIKLFDKRAKDLAELTIDKYRPDASTPLYDAIGFSVGQLQQITEGIENCDVLVTILTDGEENASREYTARAIKSMISGLSAKNWTFTYIGANHDVERVAFSLAIPNRVKFDASEAGLKKVLDHDKQARSRRAEKLSRGESVKEDYFAAED